MELRPHRFPKVCLFHTLWCYFLLRHSTCSVICKMGLILFAPEILGGLKIYILYVEVLWKTKSAGQTLDNYVSIPDQFSALLPTSLGSSF